MSSLSLPFREDLESRLSSGSSAFCAENPASMAAPTPPTSGRPPPWMAVSTLDWYSVDAMPTYSTLMSGFAFWKSAMISFQMSVRTPPLLSQKTILPLPLPSSPLSPPDPLPSSPQAVAVSARTDPRATAMAARLLLRILIFIDRLSSSSDSSGELKLWGKSVAPGSQWPAYGAQSSVPLR